MEGIQILMVKTKLKFPLYITKRGALSQRNIWMIRVGGILVAFLLAGIICSILSPGTFFDFFIALFKGSFSSTKRIFKLLCSISIYLLLSIAVVPAFKMRFWNIGVEGQALVGCLVSAVILYMVPKTIPDGLVIVLALISAILAGVFWAIIPTFFKLKFHTNETLFTLLMNYIATPLVLFTVAMVDKSGHGTFPLIPDSRLIIDIGGVSYLPIIICAVVFTVLMYIYLKKTKQGFELSVLGDSNNTARYIGISVKKVSYRTMIMSGVLAGLVGFLLVCCQNGTLSSNLVGGRGFTAVLIAWLGHFNPGEIALYSFIVGFLDYGTNYAAGTPSINLDPTYFSGLIIGLFIIVLVVAEFFVRYNVRRHLPNEILEIKSEVVNSKDNETNKQTLLKTFINIGALTAKKDLIRHKSELSDIKDQRKVAFRKWLKRMKLDVKDRIALNEELAKIQSNYVNVKREYRNAKKQVKIKFRCERIVLRSNTRRLKNVINNKIATTTLVFKSGTMIYPTKQEVNNFLNAVRFTDWEFNPNLTIKNILNARKQKNKMLREFNGKYRNGLPLQEAYIQKVEKTIFEYYLIGSEFFASRYLKYRKRYFALAVKTINNQNLKKKARAEKRAKKKGESK